MLKKEKMDIKDEIFDNQRLSDILTDEERQKKEKEKWLREQGLL